MFTHGGTKLVGLGDLDFSDYIDFGGSSATGTPSFLNSFTTNSPSPTLAVTTPGIGDWDISSFLPNWTDPNTLTSTISAPTSTPSSWETQLANLIPGFANTTEKILTTQYSIPQTSAGQFYSNKNGVVTTYTLPSNSSSIASGLNPFGSSLTSGSLLPILLIGGVALFFLSKSGK